MNPHAVLDIPFSAVADTLVLPYTIPHSYDNAAHPERRPRYDELGDIIRDQPAATPPCPTTQPK